MNNAKYYNDSLAYDFDLFMPKTQNNPRAEIVKMPKKNKTAKRAARREVSRVSSIILVGLFLVSVICAGIASLDASVGREGDDEDSVLGDFVEDEERVSPEDSAATQILKEQLASIISTLSDREQKIIKMRFGIGGERPHTLEEVGAEFSVTRERIRQIEAKALSKLRKHKDTKKLHEYLR